MSPTDQDTPATGTAPACRPLIRSTGDRYVSVQRGRVANAKHVQMFTDAHPGHDLLTGRRPVLDFMPAPNADRNRDSGIMTELADQWLASQRAQIRRPA